MCCNKVKQREQLLHLISQQVAPRVYVMAKYLIELSLTDYKILEFLPSQIAAASLSLCMRLQRESSMVSNSILCHLDKEGDGTLNFVGHCLKKKKDDRLLAISDPTLITPPRLLIPCIPPYSDSTQLYSDLATLPTEPCPYLLTD